MAKAVVDPAELRQFANDLRRFNQDLDNHMRILQTRMQTLAQSWRDQEQTKFTAEFEEASARLVGFGKHPRCTPRSCCARPNASKST